MSGITITGMDEVISMLEEMDISEQKQRSVLNKAGDVVLKAKQNNAPVRSGFQKASIKKKITNSNGEVTAVITVNAWDAIFTEFGSSKVRSYVGWADKAVSSVEGEVVNIIAEELLK